METEQLVTTTVAARALGIGPRSLARWAASGRVRPEIRTAAGHPRWDIERLRKQLQNPSSQPEDVTMTEPTYLPPVIAAIITSTRGVVAGRRLDGAPPWSFPSGEVAAGETFEAAAVRKAREEAGIDVRVSGREIGRRVHPLTEREIIYVPCEPVDDLTVSTVNADELADPQWLDLAQVDQLMPTVYDPVRTYLGSTLT